MRRRWLPLLAFTAGLLSCAGADGPLLWRTGTAPPADCPDCAPAVAGLPCPSWLHARRVALGPDGLEYSTWHPPVDEPTGCLFEHEHGDDPTTSGANAALPAFGYAARLAGAVEEHSGYKVFLVRPGPVSDGRLSPGHYRLVAHLGSTDVGRYAQRYHSFEYDFVSTDGSGRELHLTGMGDTGTNWGPNCPVNANRTRSFASVGCPLAYESWRLGFSVIHPDDPFTDVTQVRAHVSAGLGTFDPVTVLDPVDPARVVHAVSHFAPDAGVDWRSPGSPYRGCRREIFAGPNYSRNAGRPTEYWTDAYGSVRPDGGPNTLRQRIAPTDSDSPMLKQTADHCTPGVHAPN